MLTISFIPEKESPGPLRKKLEEMNYYDRSDKSIAFKGW